MPELVVPRQEAKTELSKRIDKGREILDQSVASEQDLEQAREIFYKWSDYNGRLLERIFSDSSEANSYRASLSPVVAGLPLHQQISFFKLGVRRRIRQLESYIESLPLFQIAADTQPLYESSSDASVADDPDRVRMKVLRKVDKLCRERPNSTSFSYEDIAETPQEGKEFVMLVDEGYIKAEVKGGYKRGSLFTFARVLGIADKGRAHLNWKVHPARKTASAESIEAYMPETIKESLQHFKKDYPDPEKAAFIMMQFGEDPPHPKIASVIKAGLEKHGITGLRADDKQYHYNVFENVQTYMHGCGLGIAVFEQVEQRAFNPNVALEVGYMYALGKPVCLLKEKQLKALNTDLVSKIYLPFDAYDPEQTIEISLSRWLSDRGMKP